MVFPSAPLPVAEVVDIDALSQSVVAAIAAGIAITAAFSLALLGWTRARQNWAQEARVGAVAWGAACALAILAFTGAVVLGLVLTASD